MTKVEHSVVIERPAEQVWEYVHDPSNDTAWQSSLVESKELTAAPMRVGTRIAETRRFLGKRFEMSYEVTEYEPHRRSAIRTIGGPIPTSGVYALEPVNGGTRFTAELETDAHGFFKLAEPVFARMARREMEANLGLLKDILEAGEAPSANG
jgi:uncharacterized membrane protein